jgi:carboxylesterase
VLVVQGRLDQTIDPRGGPVILAKVSSTIKEMHWLEKSTHCIILDQEWEHAAELAYKFMERVR